MASSEVEVAPSSSSPFGCVLKDHNLRDRRPSAAHPAASKCQPNLQKTLKELVREHLRPSISPSNENSNSNQPSSKARPSLPKGRWQIKRQDHKAELNPNSGSSKPVNFSRDPSPAPSDSSISGLVQKWRGLETSDPNQLLPNAPTSDVVIASRSNSQGSDNDSTSDWESDQAPPSECPSGAAADGRAKEKIRVVDIIRKLPLAVPLKQLKAGVLEGGEGPALFSPRIRGRQAVSDLFARMARDRYGEVDALSELHTVSKFPKRGRIQSLLKIRLLTRQASAYNYRQYQEPRVYESSKSTRQRVSSVKSLRRRFSTAAAEQNDSGNKAKREMEDSSSSLVVEKASTSNPPSEVAEASKDMNLVQIDDEKVSTSNPPLDVAEGRNDMNLGRIINENEKASNSNPPPDVAEGRSDNCHEELSLGRMNDETSEPNHQEQFSMTETKETRNNEQEEVELLNATARSESDKHQDEEKGNLETESSSAESTELVLQGTALQEETEDLPREIPSSNVIWRENGSDEEAIDYGSPGRTDTFSNNEWEEYYEDDFFESNPDWIHDISRPRSYWERRRRCRYEEILESSPNNEIRQLIERGSVSAVLTSDFRDRMDQLMISSVQLQMNPISCEDEDRTMVAVLQSQKQSLRDSLEVEEEQNQGHEYHPIVTSDFRDRMDKLMMSRVQLQMHPISREDEDQKQSLSGSSEEEEEQNEDDEHHPVEEQLVMYGQESRAVEPVQEEAIREEDTDENQDNIEEEDDEQSLSYYREQTPLLELPWSTYQDQEEDSDDFEPMESTTHRQESFITNSYDHGSQAGVSIRNGSITEMELIYDIRAHMQQMYREMSELRKAVSSCVDIQSKLQSSIREEVSAAIREEVSAAISHPSSENSEGNELKRKARKGSCCICREKKADSVLYRCGHMCTCFECGSELQWSSGKCPICWAHIADVVRVCTDYY